MFASEHYAQNYQPQLVITYTAPSASLSSGTLTESNINGATVDITLDAMTFADSNLNKTNFAVLGSRITVSGISYINSTKCTLTLAYDGADFDRDIPVNIMIDGSELSIGSNIITNTIVVYADDDDETLSLSGSATEGSENGAFITAAISGGQFASTVTAAK